MIKVSVGLTGVDRALQRFGYLKQALRNKILRRSISTASVPQNKSAKRTSDFTDRTGRLRKSIGIRVRTYSKNASSVGVVGPRKGFDTFVFGIGMVKPTRYSHLVEFGHGGPRPAGPHPYLRNAFWASKPEAQARFTNKFATEVVKAVGASP